VSPHLEGDGAWLKRDEIAQILANRLKGIPQAEALALIATTGALVAPVRTTIEALNDPEIVAGGMIRDVESNYGGHYRVAIEPIKMTRSPLVFERPSPALGEHTHDILAEIGFSEHKIEELLGRGVAFAASLDRKAGNDGGAPTPQPSFIAGSPVR
jgi:crotonobetainyl-CoA:carnitine CoA-transferase CaiB-like acyl-CoA transferase